MNLPDPTSTLGWIFLAVEVVLRLVALGVIPGNRKPSTGMAWLLLILVEPIVGFIVFQLFGRTRLEGRRVARQRRAVQAVRGPSEALHLEYDEGAIVRNTHSRATGNSSMNFRASSTNCGQRSRNSGAESAVAERVNPPSPKISHVPASRRRNTAGAVPHSAGRVEHAWR